MIIKNLKSYVHNEKPTISADVLYEDCDFPKVTLYYQTNDEFSDSLTLNPDAFFVACALPAMRLGEKRIRMDEEICPVLIEGITVAIKCLINWYGGGRILPHFEVKISKTRSKKRPHRAGSFLSGGVDSLSTLRKNSLLYPLNHPASFKDCFFIYGSADIGVDKDETEIYERALENLKQIAQEEGLTIIPVYTNVRHIAKWPSMFYILEYHACMLASVAHAFINRLDMVTINSAYDIANLKPFGTHILLDPNYSSYDMKICHGSVDLSRKDRIALIGDWDFGLQRIRSCLIYDDLKNDDKLLNCGKCWKCLLTQCELLAVGKLDKTRAFANNNITKEMLLKHKIFFELENESYKDLIQDFKAIGRLDLVYAINKMVKRYNRKEIIKEIDKKYLFSFISSVYNLVKRLITKV